MAHQDFSLFFMVIAISSFVMTGNASVVHRRSEILEKNNKDDSSFKEKFGSFLPSGFGPPWLDSIFKSPIFDDFNSPIFDDFNSPAFGDIFDTPILDSGFQLPAFGPPQFAQNIESSFGESETDESEVATVDSKSICSCSDRIVKRQTNDDDENDQFRIIGGEATPPHAFPQMVVIFYKTEMCGGTILNKNFVLTAAHCVYKNTDVRQYRLLIGRYNLARREPFGKTVGAKSVKHHPKFSPGNLSNDVAVIELDTTLTFNRDVKPTCLPMNDQSYNDLYGIAVGWGKTRKNDQISLILQEVAVPIVPKDKCKKDFISEGESIDNSMICAGYPQGGKDACSGDSGGPLFINSTSPFTQIGVTSFGYRCAQPGKPGVYSDIAYNLKFITDNSKIQSGCQIYAHNITA